MKILSNPRICGLLAEKPTTLSQVMHNAGIRARRLDFHYSAFATTDTVAALDAMRVLGLRGYSLTIPHKETALEHIDELQPEVKRIGATNTVINDGERLYGYNTDYLGIERAFKEKGTVFSGKTVAIVGAGGATRAALYAFREAESIHVLARNPSKAEKLTEDFGCSVCSLEEDLDASRLDILVNASPIGSGLRTDSDVAFPVSVERLPKHAVVFDMVTKERTALLLAAEQKGLVVISGLRMLLHQALEQFILFTEESSAPVKEMEEALYREVETLKTTVF